ncbi:MAG: phosphatase PAP2 family protein [Methanolobus sp.]|nr:phosphatase PAP2 family protein [Methanolobus sp.]
MMDTQLMMILVPVVILMNIVAYFVFIPQEYRNGKEKISSGNRNAVSFPSEVLPYLLLVSFIYILVKSQGVVVTVFEISPDYALAKYILHIEGNSVSMFQVFTNPLLTYVSSFIYLFGFSFLLIFTFVALIFTRRIRALQEYALAVAIIYIIAFPFYIFTPVKVTGYTLPDVVPLLYNLSPVILEGLKSVDPFFDNCFPSLHAALSFLAMLFVVFKTDLKGFKIIAVFITLAIQFTIFYLGIHWFTDFVAGIILATLSYYLATRYHKTIIGKINVSTSISHKRDGRY